MTQLDLFPAAPQSPAFTAAMFRELLWRQWWQICVAYVNCISLAEREPRRLAPTLAAVPRGA